jgi:hypothetical protein
MIGVFYAAIPRRDLQRFCQNHNCNNLVISIPAESMLDNQVVSDILDNNIKFVEVVDGTSNDGYVHNPII